MNQSLPLRHLLYCSEPTQKFEVGSISDILASCQKNNPGLGISGFLIYDGRRFLQLLEGPPESISELYEKIRGDHRHKNTIVLVDAPTHVRQFASWFMAYETIMGESAVYGGTVTKNMCRSMAKELLQRDGVVPQTVGKFLKKIVLY